MPIVEFEDVTGHVTSWNAGAERTFGWQRAEIIGRTIPGFDAALLHDTSRTHDGLFQCSVVSEDSRGRQLDLLCVVSHRVRADGSIVAVVVVHDNTLAATAEVLRARLTRDGLTGLSNRAGLEAAIADRSQLASSAPDGPITAALFCDLDGFKSINDTLGHHAGDVVLCTVAARIGEHVRSEDFAARIGGDEFCVLATLPTRACATTLAQRLREAIAQPISIDGRTTRVGVSVGIAWEDAPGDDLVSLVRRADAAMYIDKRAKRWHRGR